MSFLSNISKVVLGLASALALPSTVTNLFADLIEENEKQKEYKQTETTYFDTIATNATPETVKTIVDKCSRIQDGRRVIPPAYHEYITYPHRDINSADTIRIGDVAFVIPPEFIAVQENVSNEQAYSIRQKGSINIARGYSRRDISITLYANGIDQINGYKVDAPGGSFFVDGIRPLLAQFLVTPFVPVVNEYLNMQCGIFNVALNDIMVSSVEGYKNCFEITLLMVEVTLAPYTETPDSLYHDMIDWDLFRFNYQRLMYKDNGVGTYLPAISNNYNGDFKLQKIKTEALTGENISDDDLYSKNNFDDVLTSNDGIKITNITFNTKNIIPLMQMSGHTIPTAQYLGGTDVSFALTFETTNEDVIGKLSSMNSYIQYLTRQYKELGSFGFIRIENELINMTGTEYIIIDQLSHSTVPGFPGLFQVNLICTAFNLRNIGREDIVGVTPFPEDKLGTKDDAISQDTKGLCNKIVQDNIVENKISRMEMYPDLHLPYYVEVDEYLKDVRAFREKHNLKQIEITSYPREFSIAPGDGPAGFYQVFVDPDYYVFYPLQYSQLESAVFDDYFKTPSGITPVTTTARNVDWGNTMDEEQKSTNTSSSSSSTSASPYSGETGNSLADLLLTKIGCGYIWGADGQILTSDCLSSLKSIHGASNYDGAEKWLGKQVFDCSGFISWGLRELGIAQDGYRENHEGVMNTWTTSISQEELQPGDLLSNSYHIAAYIGNGQTIEAMDTENGVKIGNVGNRFTRFGRVKGNTNVIGSTSIRNTLNTSISGGITNGTVNTTTTLTADHLNKFLKDGLNNAGQAIINASNTYGINPAFATAVMCHEANYGSSNACMNYNNPGGIMDWENNWSTLRRFSTIDEGINFVCKNMYNNYIAEGITTIEEFGNKYCPVGAANDPNGLNQYWIPGVREIYKNITGVDNVIIVAGDADISVLASAGSSGSGATSNSYKANEEAGTIYGSTIVDLDSTNFGMPLYLKSPVNIIIEDDFADMAIEGALSTVWDGVFDCTQALIGGIQGLTNATITAATAYTSTLSGRLLKYTGEVIDTALDIVDGALEIVQEFWLVDTIFSWTADLVQIVTLQGINNDKKYEEYVSQFQFEAEEVNKSMYYDMINFSNSGRLNKAFPTFLFLLEDDGGDWLDGRKLWGNFYLYKSIMEINIHQERSQPVHTATVSLSNYHHKLNTKIKASDVIAKIEEDPEYNAITRWIYRHTGSLLGTPKLTDSMVDVKNTLYDYININTGLNIHIRMGYGSNPIMYPTVFNGIVTDLEVGDTVEIIAQSYGIELINNVISTDEDEKNSVFNYGSEPSNIITEIMTKREGTIKNTFSKKWGEASKFGIEHFGIPRGHEVISTEREYDILKNIYFGKYKQRLYCAGSSGWFNFDGENNSNFYLYNKTPWDIFQYLTQTLPEFVCQPMYHQFECRLFFGLPWWAAKYRYDISNGSVNETAKAFSQFHYIDSMSDIIDNSVTATSEDLKTNCVAMYTLGSDLKSAPTVYSDRTILSSYQKTKTIDTTLEQDYIGWDWLHEVVGINVAKTAAIKMAVSNLVDSWNNTYKGEILIIGDSTIKPCDYVYVNDLYTQINGLCQVREVVHTISMDQGYTTSVIPDMIAMNTMNQSGIGNIIKSLISFGCSYGAVKSSRYSMINMSSVYDTSISAMRHLAEFKNNNPLLFQGATFATNILIGEYMISLLNTGKLITGYEKAVSTVGSALATAGTAIKGLKTTQKLMSVKKIKNLATGIKTAKTAITAAGTTACPGLGTAVAWVVGTIVFDVILGAIIDEFAYNNSIKVFPMTYKEGPLIAGAKGQSKLIVGITENSSTDGNGNEIPDDATTEDNNANNSVD